MSFASGLLANIGFVHAMSHSIRIADGLSLDLSDTVFIVDRDSHWSIWKAVESLRGSQRLIPYKHNDMDSLESALRQAEGHRPVVIFESVYSADGSVAPVGATVDLAERYGALTFVDDANGFLIYGDPGRPFAAEFDALKRVTFHMVSFSKAVGLEGGGLAGPQEFIEVFEWLSGTSSFTATMLPPAASAAITAIDLIQNDPSIVDGYLQLAANFRQQLIEHDYTVSETPSYITTVHIGADDTAEAVRRDFLAAGYLVPVFRYPAVPRGHAGLRLMLSADHTPEHLAVFVRTLDTLRARYGF